MSEDTAKFNAETNIDSVAKFVESGLKKIYGSLESLDKVVIKYNTGQETMIRVIRQGAEAHQKVTDTLRVENFQLKQISSTMEDNRRLRESEINVLDREKRAREDAAEAVKKEQRARELSRTRSAQGAIKYQLAQTYGVGIVAPQTGVEEQAKLQAVRQAFTDAVTSSSIASDRIKEIIESVISNSGEQFKGMELNFAQAVQTMANDMKKLTGIHETEQEKMTRQLQEELANRKAAEQTSKFAGLLGPVPVDATVAERIRYRNLLQVVKETLAKVKLEHKDVERVVSEVAQGIRQDYTGELKIVARVLGDVKDQADRMNDSARRRDMAKAAKEARQGFQDLEHQLRVVHRIILYDLTRRGMHLLTQAIRRGVEEATKLSIRIAEVQTISHDVSQPYAVWAARLRELSDRFGQLNIEVVEGAYQTLSNQVAKGAETFEFMNEAMRLGTATVSTTAQAVSYLSSVINAYGKSTADAYEISAKMFKTVELGRLRLEEVAESLGRSLAFGNLLGVGLEEVNAALAVFTRQGVKANVAQTFLVNMFNKLLRPTDAMKKALRSLGVETGKQALATWGLFGTIEKLNQVAGDNVEVMGEQWGRIRAISGAALASGRGIALAEEVIQAQLIDSYRTYDEAVTMILDNSGKRIEIQMNKIKNYFTQDVGGAFITALDSMGQGTDALSKSITFLSGALVTVTAALGAYKTATVIAKVATAGFGASIGKFLGGFNVYALAAAAVVATVSAIIFSYAAAKRATRQFFVDLRAENDEYLRDQIRDYTILTDEYKRQLQKRTQASLDAFANEAASLSKLSDANEEILISANKAVTEGLGNIEGAIRAHIKELNAELRESERVLSRVNKEVAQVSSDWETQGIEQTLEALTGTSEVFGYLERQIQKYQREAARAVQTGDLEKYIKSWETIRDLQSKLADESRKLWEGAKKYNVWGIDEQAIKRHIDAQNRLFEAAKARLTKTRDLAQELYAEELRGLKKIGDLKEAEKIQEQDQIRRAEQLKIEFQNLVKEREKLLRVYEKEQTADTRTRLKAIDLELQYLKDFEFPEMGIDIPDTQTAELIAAFDHSSTILDEVRNLNEQQLALDKERTDIMKRAELEQKMLEEQKALRALYDKTLTQTPINLGQLVAQTGEATTRVERVIDNLAGIPVERTFRISAGLLGQEITRQLTGLDKVSEDERLRIFGSVAEKLYKTFQGDQAALKQGNQLLNDIYQAAQESDEIIRLTSSLDAIIPASLLLSQSISELEATIREVEILKRQTVQAPRPGVSAPLKQAGVATYYYGDVNVTYQPKGPLKYDARQLGNAINRQRKIGAIP